MIQKKTVVTMEGLKRLEEELEDLKINKRKEISEKIKVALSFGDLSENSEYDEAKNEQGIVEARIAELEALLKNVTLVDESELSTEAVNIGSRVKIKDSASGMEMTVQIVGSTEANPMTGKISDESPLGRALIGRSVGDIAEYEAPIGAKNVEIMEILR